MGPSLGMLPDIVRYWSRRDPGRRALVDSRRELTFEELDARSDVVAGALAAAGVPARAHVGFLAKNGIEFWEMWFGATKAGCALAPFNWRCPAAELVDLVDDAQVPVLVVGKDFADTAAQVCLRAARPPLLIVVDREDAVGEDYEAWLAGAVADPPEVTVADTDTALLAYTSGTTGAPKGAELPHRAFAAWFALAADDPDDRWTADDVALMVMPNFHLAGSWVSLPALYHGAPLVIVEAFEPAAVLAAIETHRPTTTCLVPTAVQVLLDDPRTAEHDLSSLARVLYAGSPIAADTLRRALEVFGCDLLQFYGTTETYIISFLRPHQHDVANPELLRSCGAPVPRVEVRIVEPGGAGEELPVGGIGEVLVRSPLLFRGYWRRPDATAEAMVDGWYRTGDLGRRDDEGNLYLVDRAKDMIVTGGENVYSVEVERALARHPGVAAVAVVGEPDARWGERIVAFVVARPGATPTVEDLVGHCRELIAGYKVPKVVHLVAALPTTASGKVQKAVLRARLEDADVHGLRPTPTAP